LDEKNGIYLCAKSLQSGLVFMQHPITQAPPQGIYHKICNAIIGAIYIAKTNNQSTRHKVPSKPKKAKSG
jgi:hypothetical protein